MKHLLSVLIILFFANSVRAESLSDVQSDLADAQELAAYQEWVASISADFTSDLCYLFEFRRAHDIAAQPISLRDNLREMYYTAKDWDSRLSHAYAAHLVLSGRAIKSLFDFSVVESSGDFLVIDQGSAFTRALISTAGFHRASQKFSCRRSVSNAQFQKILIEQDLASRGVGTLVAFGGVAKVLKLGSAVLGQTAWGMKSIRYLRPLFTKNVVTTAAVGLGVTTLAFWAHDVNLLFNHKPEIQKVSALLAPAEGQLSQDFLSIMTDELYLKFDAYMKFAQTNSSDMIAVTRRREHFKSELSGFMARFHDQLIERDRQLEDFIVRNPELKRQTDVIQSSRAKNPTLDEAQIGFLANYRLHLKINLILEFYKGLGDT